MENNFKFSRRRFFVIFLLLLVGIALCCDLAYIFYKTNFHEAFAPSFCSVSDFIDCDGVSKTSYAVSLGVPNALWGMLLYFVMMMLLFVDRIQNKFKNTIFDVFQNPRSYIATLALLSFAISMILAFISIKVIHKVCVMCFATYIVDFLIALVACSKGIFIYDIKTTILDFIKGAKEHFILFLIVLAVFSSTLVYLDKTMILSPKLKRERQYKEFYQAKKNKYAIKGNDLGKKDAKVEIILYSDYACPFCRVANIMLHKLAKNENVLIKEMNYPLDTTCNIHIRKSLGGHEASCLQAQYALAAKRQGKFWGATSVLFDEQPKTPEDIVKEFKKAHLGLDYARLNSDASSPSIINELRNEIQECSDRGVQGTPLIEINGVQYMGLPTYDELVERVHNAQKRFEKEQEREKEKQKEENK